MRFKTFAAACCNKIFSGCQPRELTRLTAREDFIAKQKIFTTQKHNF